MIDQQCLGFKLLRWRVRRRGGSEFVYLEAIDRKKKRREFYCGPPDGWANKRKKNNETHKG